MNSLRKMPDYERRPVMFQGQSHLVPPLPCIKASTQHPPVKNRLGKNKVISAVNRSAILFPKR